MAAIVREELERETLYIRSPTLTTYSRRIAPGVIVMRQFGADASDAMAGLMMRELVRIIEKDGSIAPYVDMRGITRFDAGSRKVWTEFFQKYRKAMRPACGLINSKLIEMATALIGLAVGSDITRTTTSEQEFLELIAKVDPTFTRQELLLLSDEGRASRAG